MPTLDPSSSEPSPGPRRLSTDETPSTLHSEPQRVPPTRSQTAEAPVWQPSPGGVLCAPAAEDPSTNMGPDVRT